MMPNIFNSCAQSRKAEQMEEVLNDAEALLYPPSQKAWVKCSPTPLVIWNSSHQISDSGNVIV